MINKAVLLFCFLLACFTLSKAQQFEKIDQDEYLHGKVKAVLENKSVDNKIIRINLTITKVNYGNQGLFKCYIANKEYASLRYFDDKYVKPNKDQDTTGKYIVDQFNANGEKYGIMFYLKDTTKYCRNAFKNNFYDYNNTTLRVYTSTDSMVFRQDYTFDKKGFLTGITNYPSYNEPALKITYKYVLVDSKGNWTKRIEYRVLKNGTLLKPTITTRKITYY